MHSLGIVQWNSTRRDHPGNLGGVFGSGPVIASLLAMKERKSNQNKIKIMFTQMVMPNP